VKAGIFPWLRVVKDLRMGKWVRSDPWTGLVGAFAGDVSAHKAKSDDSNDGGNAGDDLNELNLFHDSKYLWVDNL
jgi:hypothetical protein